jgi:hypothetical protein
MSLFSTRPRRKTNRPSSYRVNSDDEYLDSQLEEYQSESLVLVFSLHPKLLSRFPSDPLPPTSDMAKNKVHRGPLKVLEAA